MPFWARIACHRALWCTRFVRRGRSARVAGGTSCARSPSASALVNRAPSVQYQALLNWAAHSPSFSGVPSACAVGSDPSLLSTPYAGRTCRTGSHSSLSHACAGAGARAAGAGTGASAGVGAGACDGAEAGATVGRQSRQKASRAWRSSGVTLPKTCPTRRARSCTKTGSSGRAGRRARRRAFRLGATASPVPALGAGTRASPMRTPFPCGLECGRAVSFTAASAAAGGIAGGGGDGGAGAGVGAGVGSVANACARARLALSSHCACHAALWAATHVVSHGGRLPPSRAVIWSEQRPHARSESRLIVRASSARRRSSAIVARLGDATAAPLSGTADAAAAAVVSS